MKSILRAMRGFALGTSLAWVTGISFVGVSSSVIMASADVSIEQVSKFISEVGFPVFLVVVLTFGSWQAIQTVWNTVAPGITDWLAAMKQREVSLVESAERHAQLLEDLGNRTLEIQESSLSLQRSNQEVLNRVAVAVTDTCKWRANIPS